MHDVELFVATIGQSCFTGCIASLKQQSYHSYVIHVVKDLEPMHEAFNYMIQNASAKLWVQVDEDFVLYPDALKTLVSDINKQPPNVMCVCADLFDTTRKKKIQGIKIYRTAMMKEFEYKNTIDCEMEIVRQAEAKGYKIILTHTVVGEHSPGYDNKSTFFVYKSQYEKQRVGFNVLTDDLNLLLKEFKNNHNSDEKTLYALCGAITGITTPRELLGYERDKAYYNDPVFKKLETYFNMIENKDVIVHEEDPSISVLMPIAQMKLDYLKAAVNSIINQTFRDWEFIIVHYKIDNTLLTYLNNLAKMYRRIKIVEIKRPGVRDALNEGLKHTKGKYIARMDGDDLSDVNRFATQIAFLKAHPEYGFCGTSSRVIDQDGKESGYCENISDHHAICEKLKRCNTFTHGSIMIKGDILREHKYSQNPMASYAEDYELWLRLVFCHGIKCTNIILPLYSWRNRTREVQQEKVEKEGDCIRLMHAHYSKFWGNIALDVSSVKLDKIIPTNETLDIKGMQVYAEEVSVLKQVRETLENSQVIYNIDGLDNIHKELPRYWEYGKGMYLTRSAHNVLDAGSGFSIFPLALATTGKEVSSVDLAFLDNRVYQAAKLHLPIQNWVAKFCNLPFPDECFDAVYCVSCLEHIKSFDELYQSLSEFRRVMKHGSLLYITVDYHKTYYDYGEASWEYAKSTRYFNADMLKEHIVNKSGLTLVGNPSIVDNTDWEKPPLYSNYTFAAILLLKE